MYNTRFGLMYFIQRRQKQVPKSWQKLTSAQLAAARIWNFYLE